MLYFIDLAKALDAVNRQILLKKLHLYGIGLCVVVVNRLPQWPRTMHLCEWHARIQTSGHDGAPQGSISGPVSFFIYINDFTNVSNILDAILFADDSTFYISGPDPNHLFTLVGHGLAKLLQWCTSDRVTIDANKTTDALLLPILLLIDQPISEVAFSKFLDVTVDESLRHVLKHIDGKLTYLTRLS